MVASVTATLSETQATYANISTKIHVNSLPTFIGVRGGTKNVTGSRITISVSRATSTITCLARTPTSASRDFSTMALSLSWAPSLRVSCTLEISMQRGGGASIYTSYPSGKCLRGFVRVEHVLMLCRLQLFASKLSMIIRFEVNLVQCGPISRQWTM